MAHTMRIVIHRATTISLRCVTSPTYFQVQGRGDSVQLLSDQGATSTLDYMQQYWLNADGTNEELWNVRHVRTELTSR